MNTVTTLLEYFNSGSSKALEMVAYDFSKASYEAGVMYSELRFNPPLLALSSLAADKVTLTNDEVMDAIISGLDKGKKEFEIDVNMVICFTTNKPGKYRNKVESSHDLNPTVTVRCIHP